LAGARPLVSVVMPNFNKGPYVAEAVRSVLTQTLSDFELVAVDDASTDSSRSLLEDLASTDSRLKLVLHSSKRGPSAARNTGIRAASGAYVALIDSDDVYSPTWLEHGLEALSEDDRKVVYSDWWVMGRRGRRIRSSRPHPRKSGLMFSGFLLQSLEVNTAIMAPRECFLRIGLYDESIPWGEDYDMVLRLAQQYPFVYLDEEAYGYRLHPGNSWKRFSREQMYAYKASTLERHLSLEGDRLTPQERREVETTVLSYHARSGQTRRFGIKGGRLARWWARTGTRPSSSRGEATR
jgi:glycosyltransferase involved in cell wall biosynthesis